MNLVPLAIALFMLLALSTSQANLITFDDISTDFMDPSGEVKGVTAFITNGYENLNWVNFYAENGLRAASTYGTDGYYYGMLTASNVAFNGSGFPAEIDSAGTNFNFLSAYLTGAFNSNLNIEVEGFSGATLLYGTTVVASATSPMLFTFNYLDIDRLYFNSFGGQSAGFPNGAGDVFAMDNLTVEFIPEPSSLLLATVGALLLWPLLRRKRA